MALYFLSPKSTFIHIPKTAGSSFQSWTINNSIGSIDKQRHCNADIAEKHFKDLGFTFSFVRNPFDRLVSMFYFSAANAQIRKNEGIGSKVDDRILCFYRLGFDAWVNALKHNDIIFKRYPRRDGFQNPAGSNQWWDLYTNQVEWFSNKKMDLIIKIENLKHDFLKIQKHFNCYADLPYENTSNRSSYKDYYKSNETKKSVYEIYKVDLDYFNYDF